MPKKGFPYLYVEWGERSTTTISTSTATSSSEQGRERGSGKGKMVSSECTGFVFVFDREHESGEEVASEDKHYYCLDILAGRRLMH